MLFTRSRQWQSSSGCHRDGNDSDGTDTDATDAGVSYSNRQGQREPLKRHKERATPFSPMMVHGWCNVTHRLLHLSSLFPRCARFAHHLPRRNEMCVTTRLLPFVSFVIASDSISTNWWEDNDLQWMATSCFVGVVGYFLCIRKSHYFLFFDFDDSFLPRKKTTTAPCVLLPIFFLQMWRSVANEIVGTSIEGSLLCISVWIWQRNIQS